ILEGEAEVVISGKKQTVEAGEMILLPADRPHSLKANAKFKMMLMMIRV
ncbi:MAG: cupin domain-containing protein, partial [Actinomycetia bacterium]|nr:cupin domain-containing protein [Actinomycetes bacterium]